MFLLHFWAFMACSRVNFNFTFTVNVNPNFQDRVHRNFSATLKEIREAANPNWRRTGTTSPNPKLRRNLDNPQEWCAWTGDDYVTIHERLSLSCHGLVVPIYWSCSEVSTCIKEVIFMVNDAEGGNDKLYRSLVLHQDHSLWRWWTKWVSSSL